MKFILTENQFKNKFMGKDGLAETLEFDTNYSDFMNFYYSCEETIYRKIMEIYETLKEPDEKRLIIIAKINGFVFDTNFDIRKSDSKLLKEFICPYFERHEDYETCEKILKMCD